MLNNSLRFGLLGLLVLVTAVTGRCEDLPAQADWVAFASDDGKVTAQFPKMPTANTQTVNTAIGKLTVKMHIIESDEWSFLISHLTYPVDPKEYDADEGLKGAVNGAAANIGGAIVESANIKQGGFPGKEVLIQGKEGIFVKVRMSIDPQGPTLFQGLVVGSKEFVTSVDAKYFLDSIKVK